MEDVLLGDTVLLHDEFAFVLCAHGDIDNKPKVFSQPANVSDVQLRERVENMFTVSPLDPHLPPLHGSTRTGPYEAWPRR